MLRTCPAGIAFLQEWLKASKALRHHTLHEQMGLMLALLQHAQGSALRQGLGNGDWEIARVGVAASPL